MREISQKLEYNIRFMEEQDIPQVLDVDREAFPTQWPYPTYSSFKQELRNRLAHYIVAYKTNDFYEHQKVSSKSEISQYNKGFFYRLFNFRQQTDETPSVGDILPPPSQQLILGMSGFWMMVGEAHIITIAVRQSYRNLGIGEKLLISVIEYAMDLKANMVTLEVRVSNSLAQDLYKKYGFIPTGERKKYYTDNGENAIIMSTGNITCTSYITKLRQLKETHLNKWGN